MTPPRGSGSVLVCGSRFAQVYLSAFDRPGCPFRLAGILARGGERSRASARQRGVPLYTAVDQVPDGIELACVVVSSGVGGGPGARLAQELMARGVHVLIEHPIHHEELAACLRVARRHRVQFQVNTFSVHLEPVRRFVIAARALTRHAAPLFVDAAVASQVAYGLFDVLGQALGGLRPWGFGDPAPLPGELAGAGGPPVALQAVVAGTPLTLRVHNRVDPAAPDEPVAPLHAITLGTAAGSLSLATTHGPVLWSPRLRFPTGGREDPGAAVPTTAPLGPPVAPNQRAVFTQVWPDGVLRALTRLRELATQAADPLHTGQSQLTVARMWQELTSRTGYPEAVPGLPPPVAVRAADLLEPFTAASGSANPSAGGPR